MIRKYIIEADDSIKGFDGEIAKLEREWGAEEIEPSEDCISREETLNKINGLIAEYIPLMPTGWTLPLNIAKTINELPSVTLQLTRWIPVSERSPKIGQRILVTYNQEDEVKIDITNYTKHGFLLSVVKAWMPLPEPYQSND